MKKLIAIVFAICLIALASCTTTLFGDYGVVTSVEVNTTGSGKSREYKYLVGITHPSSPINYYKINTNKLYSVGDTIEVVGKCYK